METTTMQMFGHNIDILSIVCGFLSGVVLSVVSFLINNYIFAPKVKLSKGLCFLSEEDRYAFKLMNSKWGRVAYDISIFFRYHFADGSFYTTRPKDIALIKRTPFCDKEQKKENNKPYEFVTRFKNPKLSDGAEISVGDFFKQESTEDKPYIDVVVVSYDMFSGSTRAAIKERYYAKNIKKDCLFKDAVLEPVEVNKKPPKSY